MMSKLVLIQGLPGSGKSTTALEYTCRGYQHVEEDMFYTLGGKYHFVEGIPYAVAWMCYEHVKAYLDEGKDVVVSNVFLTRGEVNLYSRFSPTIITMKNDFGSIHNVPQSELNIMKEKAYYG